MIVRDATEDDLPGIVEIYNDAVRTTTSIWNGTPVDLENRRAWLNERQAAGFPVLVAVEDDAVLAYATYGPFRPHEGYRHTAENSIYVQHDARGRGIGRTIMLPLIARARQAGMHVLIGAVEAENTASLRLHASLGFTEGGRLAEVGTKFGRWLDLVFVQLRLDDVPR
ncbi:L-amino acid N-acyltransferase YncA [Amorphus suaedae]